MKHQEVTAEQLIQPTCQSGRALSALGKCLALRELKLEMSCIVGEPLRQDESVKKLVSRLEFY